MSIMIDFVFKTKYLFILFLYRFRRTLLLWQCFASLQAWRALCRSLLAMPVIPAWRLKFRETTAGAMNLMPTGVSFPVMRECWLMRECWNEFLYQNTASYKCPGNS